MSDAPVGREAAKLDEFEKAVYCRKGLDRIAENDAAMHAMLQCLSALGDGAHFAGYAQTGNAQYTRFVSAVIALFLSRGFTLTQAGFNHLAGLRAVLESAFKASIYDGSDHVFGLIPEDGEGLTKFVALFSMTSELQLDLETLFREDPQAMVGLWMSLVSYGQTFGPAADARREHLLTLAPLFEDVTLSDELLNVLCSVYMHCSYAHGEGKHAPKAILHRMLMRMMKPPPLIPAPRPPRARPVVLVVLDWWWSKHAMFRCYSQAIKSLKEDFTIVGVARTMVTDEEGRAVFDRFISIPDGDLNMENVSAQIRAEVPDIVYYPSIGMSLMTILMASLRLAPIQVMSYGHPATSMSPMIDYGILESDLCNPECFSEQIIQLPPGTIKFVPYAHEPKARHTPRMTDTLKIAVSAMQVKVSWPFVRAMQEVQRRAKKKVEFHFFCAVKGVGMNSFTREISKLLDNTVTHEMAQYDEYMAWVAECDLCLFSFPFGGTNSVIDCFQLGIPLIGYEGREPHSMTDSSLIRRAGLPYWLIAHSEAEYVDAVLALEDDERRAEVARLVRAVDVDAFFRPDETKAFLKAFRTVYSSQLTRAAA